MDTAETNRRRPRHVAAFSLILSASIVGDSLAASPLPLTADHVAAEIAAAGCSRARSDGVTTSSIESRLLRSSSIESDDVRVLTRQGRVELRGLVRSEAQKRQAASIARDTYGVVAVRNDIDVVDWAPITDTARALAQSRAVVRQAAYGKSDAWIAGAVKATLDLSRGAGSCAIAVTTRAGVVSLSGQVGSDGAHAVAVDLARDTLGVRRVDAESLRVR